MSVGNLVVEVDSCLELGDRFFIILSGIQHDTTCSAHFHHSRVEILCCARFLDRLLDI